jgi:two-component system sensor histidine kinase YesM
MFKDDFVSSNSAIGKSGNITSFNMVKCYTKSNEGVFTLVSEKTGLFSKTQYIAIVIILIITILVTIILAFILAYILASRLYKYIANIMLSLNGQAGEDENKELNKVIETIAGNSLNSSQVESELAEKVALLRQSQTIALQTQITPHFLYNTLQAINFITIKLCGGNNDASRMIVLFSDLLHSALDTKSYLVPLKQEIGYVEQYLEIQKYKYGDKFKFILDVPEETKNLTVVKLMLQPIIENAIHHGILPTRKICRIILSAKLTSDKKLVVKISNDGVSIPPDKVLEINRCLETQKELTQSNHIGLPNVNRRIKLIFGEEYGCSVHSTEELTIITITLPA